MRTTAPQRLYTRRRDQWQRCRADRPQVHPAQAAETEQVLWKVVFYRVIAEFRARIQKAAAAGDKQREALRKVPYPTISPAARLAGLQPSMKQVVSTLG